MALNDQHRRFCQEYLKDFNATAAYLRAGYQCSYESARRSASDLLTKPDIQRYLSELRDRVSKKAEVSLERTLQEVARVAFADITSILSFDGDGVKFKDSADFTPDITAAIESISGKESAGEDGNPRLNLRVRMHNKMTALTLLADFFGIRDDFNKARATLKRYGLALIEDEESACGWTVVKCEE